MELSSVSLTHDRVVEQSTQEASTVWHAERKSGPRHTCHAQLNNFLWRSIKKAQVPAVKVPVGRLQGNGKRPDVVTLVPWSRVRPRALHITVPDTFAASHLNSGSIQAASAAESSTLNKCNKYADIASTHLFVPVTVVV